MSTNTQAHRVWNLIEQVLTASRRTLLFGPPGTGKTFVASKYGLIEDQKVYQVTVTEETPAAELRGHFVPKGDQFIWMDGPGLRAWREGSRFVINEIDRAAADTMSFLNVLLDDPEFAELTLPTGEIVRPHPDFQVVATMNGEPEDLEPSLRDRFPVTIEVTAPNPEAIKALPEDLQEAAKNGALISDPSRKLSIRAWLEFNNLRLAFSDSDKPTATSTKTAAKAVFGDRATEVLRALGGSTE